MFRILLIDQDTLFRKAFSKMIAQTSGCELIGIAKNGMEAMELMDRFHPDIVFSDVMIGIESGISICNTIHKCFPETVIYILSSYCSKGTIKESMDAGVAEYLYKPLSRNKLSVIVSGNEKAEKTIDNSFMEDLYNAVEERSYKKTYDSAKKLVNYLFCECDVSERKQKLLSLESKLFYLIPGISMEQKDYYIQKYEVTSRVLNKSLICYCFIMQIATEVFRQICTMKYVQMDKVLQYVEKNIHEEISLSELAEEAGISNGYLSRIFKKFYKISVVDYIHLRKLIMAKYYMVTSEMNISDISFLLGYSEAGYFCKIFKKYEGQTPSAFCRTTQNMISKTA